MKRDGLPDTAENNSKPQLADTDQNLRKFVTFVVLVSLIELVAFVNAWPHMSEDLWQDEAATLLHYAGEDVFYPFVASSNDT